MRRLLVRCVLLGAVTTVAVAWVIAAFVDMSRAPAAAAFSAPFADGGTLWRHHTGWLVLVHQRAGSVRVIATTGHHDPRSLFLLPFDSRVPQPVRRLLLGAEDPARPEAPGWLVWDARGWPFPALACRWPWWRWPGGQYPPVAWGVPLPNHALTNGFRQGALRAIPLWPRWGAFALDTGLYAALWLVLLGAPRLVRRVIARRPGCCAACGYDLAGLPDGTPCPECGVGRATGPPVAESHAP